MRVPNRIIVHKVKHRTKYKALIKLVSEEKYKNILTVVYFSGIYM